MKRVEEMMGWVVPDNIVSDTRAWIDHVGQYRDRAEVDDIVSWFRREDFIMSDLHYSPMYDKFMVTFVGTSTDVIATAPTVMNAMINAVHTWTQSKTGSK